MACNTNSTSIPLTNLKVLYEKDAVLHGPLEKTAWSDIVCPADIDHYDSSEDRFNCVCVQKHGWEPINDLNDIKLSEPFSNNVNVFWVRGTFYIKDAPGRYYGIYLDYLQGRDVIYVNNRLAGIKNTDTYLDIQRPSRYMVPPGALVKGENRIDMRLEIFSSENGGVSPYLFIQTQSDFNDTAFRDRVRYDWLRAVSFILICVLFMYCAIYAFREKNQKIYMLSSLFLLFYIMVGIAVNISLKHLNVPLFYRSFILFPSTFTLFIILFFQVLYGLVLYRVNIILIFFILLYDAGYIVLSGGWSGITRQNVYAAIVLFGFFSMIYILFRLNREKPDRLKLYLFSFIVFVFIIAMTCIGVSFKVKLPWWPYYPGDFLNPVYLLIFSIYTVSLSIREKRKERIEFEKLYKKFNKQKDKQPVNITVTGSSEEKLERVIAFINENYTEDISREGLAAAIDMNPNYLSTLFNVYTGKKFQEYINMLRIKKAAQLIQDTDEKIADIASSVGFLNLATFIRTFKKEMGKTPKEYRENNNI